MKSTTTVRADAFLQNLPDEAHQELWELRHPEEEDGKVWTLTDIAAWIPSRFNRPVSKSAVGNFYQWLALKRRMDAASERALQAKLELAKDPDITPDAIERVGQTIFAAEALESGNIDGYVALAKLRLAGRKMDMDDRKLALLEAKAAKADTATDITNNSDLTEEEKAARIKQLFRMG